MKKLLLGLLFAVSTFAQVPVSLSPVAHQQFFSTAGTPLAGGKICTYNAGTTTPAATYVDINGIIANTNPIILDSSGFATIYLANQSYKFVVYDGSGNTACPNSGVQQWAQDNVNAFQVVAGTGSITFTGVTSDPTGIAGLMDYRSDIPCFRSFTTAWDCFVRLNDFQTLTNKTFDVGQNRLNNTTGGNTAGHFLRNNGTQYVDSTIQSGDLPTNPVLNGVPTGTALGGTTPGSLLLTVSTDIPSSSLCTDANGSATTTGCPTAGVVYNTPSASGNVSLGSVTLGAAGVAGNIFEFSATITETVVGTSCSGNTTVQVNLVYTDAVTGALNLANQVLGASNSSISSSPVLAASGNGNVGNVINYLPILINAKASSTITMSTTYAGGSGCSPPPAYYIQPLLVRVK